MIRKGSALLATILVLLSAVFGIWKRSTYTDTLRQPDALETAQVGELPEEYAKQAASEMESELPNCNIILRIKATGEFVPEFGVGRQTGIVQQVYQGNGVSTGQEISIVSERWAYSSEKSDEGTQVFAQMGYVNHMKQDREYLVFLDGPAAAAEEESTASFLLADDCTIVPVFCYDTIKNVVVDTAGAESTYVAYTSVRDNEFFMCTEEGLQAILDLKAKMLALYPME